MNGIRYKDQSAGELRLHVVAGWLDVGRFPPLATARLERSGLCVQASVIGASHVIRIADAQTDAHTGRVTEIVACGTLPTDISPAFSGWLRDIAPAAELQLSPRLRYCFAASRTDRRSGLPHFQALEQRIAEDPLSVTALGLDYSFPERRPEPPSGALHEGASEVLPKTGTAPRTLVCVALDPHDRRVTIETAHSYPNEDTIVFSHSTVSFGGRPAERLRS